MARERRVVCLQVQLEVRQQIVFAQKIQTRGGIGIVLMLRRFFRFRLNVKLALEPDLLLVIHGQVQQFGEVIQLAFHVRVEQRHVAFAAAPKRITFAAKFVRHFHRFFNLRRSEGEHVRVATGAGSVDEPRMGK